MANAAQVTTETDDPWAPTPYTATVKATGETLFLCTSARHGDGRFRFLWTLDPGKRGPNEHSHSRDNERLEIVSGTMRIWVGGVAKDYGPGDVCDIPRGVPHKFLNPTKQAAIARVSYDGTQMEDLFAPLVVHPYPKKPGMREIARMMVAMLEQRPTDPTSKWEVRILGSIARMLRFFGVRAPAPVSGWDPRSPR
jgi:mannose-6-phosphate isomerase-like protein (cupin superfamily)